MSNDAAVAPANGFTRPDPPYEAPDGKRWEAVPAGPAWVIAEDGKKCRFRGKAPRACAEPASVAQMIGIGRQVPWNYCAADALAHYGVWAEKGKVLTWKLKDD